MEAKSEIISFDCACRTLAWVWVSVGGSNMYDFTCKFEAQKKDKSPTKELTIPEISCRGYGIVDFVGCSVKDVSAAERASKLWNFLNSHEYLSNKALSPTTIVLIESQPFTRNEYSFAVSQQIAFYYGSYKVNFIDPRLKNRVFFSDLSHSKFTEAEKGKHGGKSGPANAKYAARKKHATENMVYYCEKTGSNMCTGVKKSQLNNVADAFMQMIAHIVSAD